MNSKKIFQIYINKQINIKQKLKIKMKIINIQVIVLNHFYRNQLKEKLNLKQINIKIIINFKINIKEQNFRKNIIIQAFKQSLNHHNVH